MLRSIGIVGSIVIVFIAIIVLGMFIGGGISMITAPFRGEVDKREKIEADGDYRIAAYDQFYSLCSAASSTQDKIENQQAQLEVTEDPDQKQVLQSGILAMENQLDETVNKYNAKAASDYTAGQFKDSDLPYQLDSEQEITCGN